MMQKIPQAVAMVLLMSALACPMCSGQAKATGKGGTNAGATATRGGTAVESLLHEFLSKVDSPEMHSRFWADDLVYVGAGGKVRTKAEIVNSVTEEAERSKANAAEAKKE